MHNPEIIPSFLVCKTEAS